MRYENEHVRGRGVDVAVDVGVDAEVDVRADVFADVKKRMLIRRRRAAKVRMIVGT